MGTDPGLIERSGPGVRRLRPSSVNSLYRDGDVLDELFKFQNTTPSEWPLAQRLNRVENPGCNSRGIATHVSFPDAND